MVCEITIGMLEIAALWQGDAQAMKSFLIFDFPACPFLH